MYFIYNIAVYITIFFLKIIALFNKKIALFIKGREGVFTKLKNTFSTEDQIIWFHCASLGEFEQGRPIIEKLKKQLINSNFYNFKILVTFFSPSGYEVRKNYNTADLVVYLPLDTKKNARKFIEIVNPKMAIFVKYEFWPNLLKALKNKQIKTILVSGIFRENQSFFKKYGKWMRKSLNTFDHFFVQNETSVRLLNTIGFNNITLSGDTRFDRVYEITKQKINLDFAEQFKDNKITLVAGSTWPKDETILIDYINNNAKLNQKYIIAPHNINSQNIEKLKDRISKKVVLYSEIENKDLSQFQVLIIDTVGILTQIYYYGDISYVGGGFGSGIHNILEPATFGIPILIGPNYHKFKEAKDLINLKACISINEKYKLNETLTLLFDNDELRKNKGNIAKNYIIENIGSTKKIINYINNQF
ncbi:3-deoxy-D-manno-octulosonic acid transferase [Aureibaculum marinum]|uniref:3-deoxy-D-manno-octulosonic acid transferase n=1 Tax=Aureibaculum marinum TaxID=2487930 RepID=A0A3N4NS76_9FLAO|nr:glycosyltransferase N-terminal domain-containing protein [Aureibaculum marinum]RPD97497.1 3-deoxy-D-manno-octulosonic acid transferase [Aureibaculum marinum]